MFEIDIEQLSFLMPPLEELMRGIGIVIVA